jgi:Uma2 family endonuclease
MTMQAEEKRVYTLEEYFELEVNSDERHAYIDGEIILMTGGLPNHNRIAGNLYSLLNFLLKKHPFIPFFTDQRLWIPERKIGTYPDVMVMSKPLEYAVGRRDTLVNPRLIAEVLSKSTQDYDRSDKFLAYRTIPTFQEYLLIDQHSIHVEHYFKTDKRRWILTEYKDLDEKVSLQSLGCEIAIADLYEDINFEEESLQ